MERSYVNENDAERTRPKELISEMSDTTLAHLAFYDRLWLAKFEEFERMGALGPLSGADFNVDALNNAMLPWWQNIAPIQVKHEVVAAAEAIDSKAASLPDWLVEAVLSKRPRTLVRAVHRREHLGEIDRALKG